jgi:hypothetical protein
MCLGWFALALISSGQSAAAGCSLTDEDGYRAFHHGQWFQPSSSQNLHDESKNFIAKISVAWVYESGNFQPVAHPLSQPCQGPKCRSNPLDSTWHTIPSNSEISRASSSIVDFSSTWITDKPSRYCHASDQEKSLRGFENRLKRPPKI